MMASDAATRPDASIDSLRARLAEDGYFADVPLGTALFLALRLGQPLLLEGDAGVGKTEAAKALATALGTTLIRLQCYDGIDASQALYEWNYARQMLHIRAMEAMPNHDARSLEADLYGREYLIARPLLRAIEHEGELPVVLLIDEIDRADDEFEAFLLETLSDFSITIPELGSIVAKRRPIVILTSNRTRELHDALKRRCLYFWIDHPSLEREIEIVRARVPQIGERLARDVALAVDRLRLLDLYKPPGVAETIDWSRALLEIGSDRLSIERIDATLGAVLKYREDQQRLRNLGIGTLVAADR